MDRGLDIDNLGGAGNGTIGLASGSLADASGGANSGSSGGPCGGGSTGIGGGNLAEALQRMDSSRFERCIIGKKTKYCCFCCISSWTCLMSTGQGLCNALSSTCIFCSDLALGCNQIMEKMECEDGSRRIDWKNPRH